MPVHAAIWPEREGRDYALEVPAYPLAAPLRLEATPPEWFEPATGGRSVTWRVGDLFRAAERCGGLLFANRRMAGPWEHFLLVDPARLALLRHLCGHDWRVEGGGVVGTPMDGSPSDRAPSDGAGRVTPVLVPGPALALGETVLPLDFLSLSRDGDAVLVEGPDAALRLDAPEALPRPAELPITGGGFARLPEVTPRALFSARKPARATIGQGPEFNALPLVVDRRDRDWLIQRHAPPPPHHGMYEGGLPIVRVQEALVLTARGQEGVVLDRDGATVTEAGYLLGLTVGEAEPISRAGDRLFLRRAVVDAAPRVAGTTVVFTSGHCSNYYHFVIEGLLPLLAMARFLPSDAAILVPETLAAMKGERNVVDHEAALRDWGFDGLHRAEAPAPLVRAADVIAPAGVQPQFLPTALLRRARERMCARHPPASTGRRLYVPRRGPRGTANGAEVEAMLQARGFETVTVDGLSPGEQAALFASAAMVVMPHGAAVTNTLFCPEGAGVIELMPDAEYRSMYADISGKLGLAHAVLPCLTDDNGFNGRLLVDTARLARLTRLVEAFTP